MVSVAIDGPAGAGKSTLARRLAAEMGYIYVDTGAMYRAIGLYALRAGKDPKDNAAVNALLPQIELRLASIEGEQHIYLKEEDVSTAIRTEAAGMAASAVGANPAVRAFLLEPQRDMAKKQDVLMDGRDIGTVVLPDATVKIFLTATPEARATRRWKEYQAKGIDTPYEEVLADVKQRDYQDTHRAAAPLKQADDAVLLDTSELDFEQSLAAMKKIAESSAVARPHNETVEQICAYLAANYRQKFSLTEVAAQFYLSPYYLSRLFRRVTGQSIVDYINNRRIEAAQKLLETTELSISAVAEQTGFASAAHFRRVFREVMGTGPLQYRKGHKK